MKKSIDLLIYVALKEEFDQIIGAFDIELKSEELTFLPLTIYRGNISRNDGSNVSVVIVPAGKMGTVHAGVLTSSLIDYLNPLNVVVLGIAGSLSGDLLPGDVFIPSRVDEYMANSAAIGIEQNEFVMSGNYYDCDRRLLDRFRNFSTRFSEAFVNWREETKRSLKATISREEIEQLAKIDVNLKSIGLKVGEDKALASGPAVAKGQAFIKWLKERFDRKIAAIEMESAGVFEAALSKINQPRIIAIRPISDIADERKVKIEQIVGDSLRIFSLKNAISLLKIAIEYGIFEPERPPTKLQQSPLVKNAFIVGGITGESKLGTFEPSNLQMSCYEIGKALAEKNINLIACSPFPDSADYYTILGYSNYAKKGKIYLHYPNHPEVIKTIEEMVSALDNKELQIIPYLHPGYPNIEARQQAWSFCQIQALEYSDVVIAIGGKLSKSAYLTLRIAEIKKITTVPFSFLGGAAKVIYDNINWKESYSNVNAKLLTSKKGIKSLPAIIGKMKLGAIAQRGNTISKGAKVFISRARKDEKIALDLQRHLKILGLDVLLGDNAISAEKSVIPSIEEYINMSQVHIVLWSKNYALSPWCYDELMIAVTRYRSNQTFLIIFNIDGSEIVPTIARSLNEVSTHDVQTMTDTVKLLIK